MAEAQEKQEKEKQEEIEKSNSSSELKEENADETDKKEDKMESGAFSPEEYEFIPEKCLFCREISDTMEECFFNIPIIPSNLTHMFQKHGLIIPDRDSVIDMEGLLDYLGQKISVGCICLTCNHGFKSPYAVRAHMLDKGHTSIAYSTTEDYEEFEEFYDYTEENDKPSAEITLLETGELMLEDGTILGAREFHRYYKQRKPAMLLKEQSRREGEV